MTRDNYDVDLLKKVLGEMGYEVYYFSQIDSTMRIIEEAAREGRENMVLALADHQTKGVGRNGRKWLDRAGNSLMFSVLMRIKDSSIAVFADLVSLAIYKTLGRLDTKLSIKIKYPNDLVVEDKKIGGILVKNIYDEKLHYLGTNLGIGLNMHYTKSMLEKFPTDYPASSLDICASFFIKRQDLLIQILQALRYLSAEAQVIDANPTTSKLFEEKWRRASSMIGRKIAILKQDKILEEGVVVNTGIGKGIQLQTNKGRKWFCLFDSDMKARIVN